MLNAKPMKERLLGKTPAELTEIARACGLPAFAGKQMAQWLYQKRVRSIEQMTNLSKQGREALAERYEVGQTQPVEVQTSRDGTRKYLFPVTIVRDNGAERRRGSGGFVPRSSGPRANACLDFPESKADVVPAEAEGIGQAEVDVGLASD